MIKYEDLNRWLQKYGGSDSKKILNALVNNQIKKEYMIDSIISHAQQDHENADMFYEQMWIKNQKPYCHECKSLNVATHDQNGSPITDFANRNGYCFNCDDFAQIKGVKLDDN
jgi:hypothetical protein